MGTGIQTDVVYDLMKVRIVYHKAARYAFGSATEIKAETNCLWFADGELMDSDAIAPLITGENNNLVISKSLVQITFPEFTDEDWKDEIRQCGLADFFAPAIDGLKRIAKFYSDVELNADTYLIVGCTYHYAIAGYYSDCPEPYAYPVIKSIVELAYDKMLLAASTPEDYDEARRENDEFMARLAFMRGDLPYESEAS